MKKLIIMLSSLVAISFLIVGCNREGIKSSNIEEISLREAKKITSEQVYTLKSETPLELDSMIGDSMVFELIKNASIEGGYLKEDFDSMTGNRKLISYELVEKSKLNSDVLLYIVVDKGKAIGAYLAYDGYLPGITSVNFIEDFKDVKK